VFLENTARSDKWIFLFSTHIGEQKTEKGISFIFVFRPKIDPTIDARKHSNPVLFDVYIQYKSYDGFMLCMDGLR